MLFVEGQCPHCNEKRGFKLFYMSDYLAQRSVRDIQASRGGMVRTAPPRPPTIGRFHAGGMCGHCNDAVILSIEIDDRYLFEMRECIVTHDKVYAGEQPTILSMIPKPTPPYSHPSLPQKVATLFVDLQTMLKQKLAPSLIITGCRSVLEESVKDIGGNGDTLFKRIEDLKNKAIVNGVLEEWARHIRVMGNDAVHEMNGTQAEADELVEFTKLFLQYTFEFPDRVKTLRTNTANTVKP